MDVNGTRFHLLQGAADWSRCVPGPGNTIALGDAATLRPLLFQLPAAATGDAAVDPAEARRGAARDRYGNWYWIDHTGGQIAVRSSGSDERGSFWPPDRPPAPAASIDGGFGPAVSAPAPDPCHFAGLTVTDDHYLIAGTLDQPGLLIFDLHQGGLPRHVRWPANVPFQPFDLAARPSAVGGGLFVLDRVNHCFWALDRNLGVVDPEAGPPPAPDAFGPADGPPAVPAPARPTFPAGITVAAASPVTASDPVAIEALPDGDVLIFDRAPLPAVHRYRRAERIATATVDLGGVLDPSPPGPPALGADLAFLAGSAGGPDRLYIPAATGAQAYAFTVDRAGGALAITADPLAPALPMRLFGGKGLVAAAGDVWYDFQDAAWLRLVEQRRPRFEREGSLETPALDGVDPGCVWHRLIFDGCLPPTASVTVWSRAADERDDLAHMPWFEEPAPRRRATGSELPLLPAPSGEPAPPSEGTFELLFQRARGRWLQVRLVLRGDGRSSPRLRALRVWYPRFSYLVQYLPAAYREDAESASFLDRFLANLEGLFTSVEDRMAVAALLFDARTAPAEALEWLASWFGVALDPAWTEQKRRLFLRHAMDFFQARGTVRGLQAALRLVIDDCADDGLFAGLLDARPTDAPASIRILEWYRLRSTPPLALGDPSPQAGIRQVASPPPWTPEQGAAALLALYRAASAAAGAPSSVTAFPLFEPSDGSAPTWRRFIRDTLSLSATAQPDQAPAWRAFLAARYPTVAALNAAWKARFADFSEVALPATLPEGEAPLGDWYQFQLGGGRFIPSRTRWIPAHGRAALEDRWRQAQQATGVAAAGAFPLGPPADEAVAAAWRQFSADVLGFVPEATARSARAWRDFLARRYRRVSALNLAHGTSYAAFDAAALPTTLPADGAPLRDWYELQSVALGTARLAHRFTVLLPVPAREAFALAQHQSRRELARRIVDLEKPAHTLYDIKFYWAMFRVGEARLAIDTLLDQSSRAPELMPPVVLDQAFLAESRLASTPRERETERAILGSASLRRPCIPAQENRR